MKTIINYCCLLIFASLFILSCRKPDGLKCDKDIACTKELVTFVVRTVNLNGQEVILDYLELKDYNHKLIRRIIPNFINQYAFSGDVDMERLRGEAHQYTLTAVANNMAIANKSVWLKKDCCHAIWSNPDNQIIIP
jgi:hypothetical protein